RGVAIAHRGISALDGQREGIGAGTSWDQGVVQSQVDGCLVIGEAHGWELVAGKGKVRRPRRRRYVGGDADGVAELRDCVRRGHHNGERCGGRIVGALAAYRDRPLEPGLAVMDGDLRTEGACVGRREVDTDLAGLLVRHRRAEWTGEVRHRPGWAGVETTDDGGLRAGGQRLDEGGR